MDGSRKTILRYILITNQITMDIKELNSEYIPQLALIIYQNTNSHESSELFKEHYLECHSLHMNSKKGAYELSAGKPLKANTLDDLANYLTDRKAKKEEIFNFETNRIPKNVIAVNQEGSSKSATWKLEHPKRKLYFDNTLNIEDGEVLLPNLIFSYSTTGGLNVYAYLDKELTNTTPLYHAPFHNTSSGSICMGTAKIVLNSSYWEDLMTAAENAFFRSIFTELHGENPVKGNLNAIYDNCIKGNIPFPTDQMIPLNKTLNDIL